MKNYLTEWKKFKNNILNEGSKETKDAIQALQNQINSAKKNNENEIESLQTQIVRLQAQAAAEAAQENAAKSVSSGPVGTTGKVEENAAGERDEGTTGLQSVSVEEELTEEELEEAMGEHEGMEEGGKSCMLEVGCEEVEEEKTCNECKYCRTDKLITEAKYKGRNVPLGKPMRGDVKKFKVFVRDPKTGNVKKVNFGDKKMRIKKSNPKRRKSFRARHRCANPGPRTKARYWSCRKW